MTYGPLILKATYSTDYLDPFVKPYAHFLLIRPDYSDLTTQLQWAIDSLAKVERIIASAKKLGDSRLRRGDLKCYLDRAILEYASLTET